MINLASIGAISPIYLTVTLIIYLMIVELGHERIRRMLMPAVAVLMVSFIIVAVRTVYLQIVG